MLLVKTTSRSRGFRATHQSLHITATGRTANEAIGRFYEALVKKYIAAERAVRTRHSGFDRRRYNEIRKLVKPLS